MERVRVLAVLVLLLGLVGIAHAERPRSERGYRHGKPVRIRVVTVGWAEVEVATARAFRKMATAARKDGIDLTIRSGFRTQQRQRELYRAWREGWGNKAARPGFSNHQSGTALDIEIDGNALAWLARHAKRYGFRQTVRGEPWHWEYSRSRSRTTARASSKRRRS